MAFVAHYDAGTGFIIGLYMDDMTLPSPTTPITNDEHEDIVADVGAWKINLSTFEVEARTMSTPDKWARIRAERNLLLQQTDWTMGSDVPIDATNKTAFETYRQDLRDIPQDYSADSATVVWPTLPTYVKD